MRDDDEDGEKHEVPTIPPPAGESDIYEAKTQVGGLPPEALAMLRQIREEKPMAGGAGEANIPMFLDDEEPASGRPRLVGPAAGSPISKPTPFAPFPVQSLTPSVGIPAVKPAAGAPAVTPKAARVVPAAEDSAPVVPIFAAASAPMTARAKRSDPPLVAATGADVEPESYASVFAPLPPSTANPELTASPPVAPGAAPARDTWMWPLAAITILVFLTLAVVLMGQAGWIPGLHPVITPGGAHPPASN